MYIRSIRTSGIVGIRYCWDSVLLDFGIVGFRFRFGRKSIKEPLKTGSVQIYREKACLNS